MLRGRDSERGALDLLLDRARRGRSGSLSLRGPPGTGKSELLKYAMSAADGMALLLASGVRAERDLPFAVLHQLFRPVFGRLHHLPDIQRAALQGALALGPPTGADRFVVSAAVLTLLADCAEETSLLCVLDDAHWIDGPSLDALLFAARRLDADRVAMLFAVRDGEDEGLHRSDIVFLDVDGLDVANAAMLVSECAGVPAAHDVMTELMAATGGNPLALTELARLLDPAQITGRALMPDPLPVSAGMEEAFLNHARGLPPETQRLLLIAAAEGTGDPSTVLSAAARLGVPAGALAAAETAGLLVDEDGRLAFRHPLVRSALYSGVAPPQRRAVHSALADTLMGHSDLDRRTWHRAAAALAPDDAVADDLVASADRARGRSGHAGAAAALSRSAGLTSDPDLRARRLIASAEEAWLAGRPETMHACLNEAGQLTSRPRLLTEITRMRARFELRGGTATDAFELFIDGAQVAQAVDPDTAAGMLAEASEAALYVGDIAGMVRAGQLAHDVAVSENGDGGFWKDLCVGIAEILQGRVETAEPRLRRRIAEARTDTHPQRLVAAGIAAVWLGEQATAMALYQRAARAARIADVTGNLPYVLEYLAAAERTRGRYATSHAVSEEGLRLSEETGQETSACNHLANLAHLAALAGDEATCLRYADEALARALPRRQGFAAARASLAIAILNLGAGHFAEALDRLITLAAAGPGVSHPAIVMFSLPDRVEAAVRTGRLSAAADALHALEGWHSRASPDAHAVTLRCRALLAGDDDAAGLYSEAMAMHALGPSPPPEVARTQLLYGEWLRRARRPAESRQHLRAAMETFDRLGAAPWAERARLELKASGETIPSRTADASPRLTPQELRIARAVAAGRTTKEIAAQLFLSPRTVEYHLHKMYPKLGISSRTDLVRLVITDSALVAG